MEIANVGDDFFANLELPPAAAFPVKSATAAIGDTTTQTALQSKLNSKFDYGKEIERQLAEPIKLRRASLGYRASLGLLSIFMMSMPLAYAAFVGLTAWLVYYYTFNIVPDVAQQTGLRGGRAMIIMWMALITPIIVGVIVVVFMCKPIFFSLVDFSPSRTRTLTRTGEPLLFELVDRICETIRAPKPIRIEVDSQVNASASYGAGLKGIFKSELVLRIGTPLVAGLSVRQLAGILAHEFGHFSQGAGMRAQLIIGAINAWFAKVVFARDAVDELLDDAIEDSESLFVFVLLLARGCVGLVRWILWGFMVAAYTASSAFSRQMEFDADRYEIALVGSDVFISTGEELHRLGYANEKSMQALAELMQKAVLIDNIPKMIQVCRNKMTADELSMIHQAMMVAKTGLLDTHPCTRQRNEVATRIAESGVFTIDRPARELIRHYDALCVNVTNDFYRNVIGRLVDPGELQPVDSHLHVLFRS